jgi:hypothetical protein
MYIKLSISRFYMWRLDLKRLFSRAIDRGVGSENRDLWALKWQRRKRLPFGPKKVEIFRAHPFQLAE